MWPRVRLVLHRHNRVCVQDEFLHVDLVALDSVWAVRYVNGVGANAHATICQGPLLLYAALSG